MKSEFDKILDECVDRLNRGESLESCLKDYPEQAKELKPLLEAMFQTKQTYYFTPSSTAKSLAKQRLFDGIEKRRTTKQPGFTWSFWPKLAATAAIIVLLIVAGYVGLRPVLIPTIAEPSPQGNFAFLISDDVNAIADFQSVTVTISRIGLVPTGTLSQKVEFTPTVNEVDLTQLQGDKTQEIWRGNVPSGTYNKVFIEVSGVQGILKTGQTMEIKLPSNRLQISKSFEIGTGKVSGFTFDMTVIATGNGHGNVKYILKPQISESGSTDVTGELKSDGKNPKANSK